MGDPIQKRCSTPEGIEAVVTAGAEVVDIAGALVLNARGHRSGGHEARLMRINVDGYLCSTPEGIEAVVTSFACC